MTDRTAHFRIGITNDFLRPDGTLAFPDIGLDLLTDCARIGVEWEYIPVEVDEITPDMAARYDGIVALRPKFTAATVARAGRRLTAIARFGVGYDRIDVPAMTAAGVLLAITPDGVRRPVAQAVLTLILALAGRLFEKDRITRAGEGFSRASEFMGLGITGRTLALLGVGNIGRDIVKLVAPFEMRVIAHDPYARATELAAIGVTPVGIDTLFREGDFVSVNCPLTDETRHIVDARRLGLMRSSAYLVNTARGPIVDEAALYATLRDRQIAGAGLDVFETEPVAADNPILTLDNVIVTPHALCWTDECFRGNGLAALGALLAVARGDTPASGIVNRAALDHPWLTARMGSFAGHSRANEEASRAIA